MPRARAVNKGGRPRKYTPVPFWRRSVLFGPGCRLIRDWWKRPELWAEAVTLLRDDMMRMEDVWRQIERERIEVGKFIAAFNATLRRRLRKREFYQRQVEAIHNRMLQVYTRLKEAERAYQRGSTFLDADQWKEVVEQYAKERARRLARESKKRRRRVIQSEIAEWRAGHTTSIMGSSRLQHTNNRGPGGASVACGVAEQQGGLQRRPEGGEADDQA